MQITPHLYRDLSHVVCAAARRSGRVTPEDAEDLTQTVLLKLWECRGLIRSPDSLHALVYRIATRTWWNSCRSRKRYAARLAQYREFVIRDSEAEAAGVEREEATELWHCVDELDARTVDAIRRRFCDGQSYGAIGCALGISNCAAHKLVKRGLDKLTVELATEKIAACSANVQVQGARCRRTNSRRRKLEILPQSDIQAPSAATQAAHARKERGQSCPA